MSPLTAMTSLTTTSIGFGLKSLDVNATAPSIGTDLAEMDLMLKTCYRNRRGRQDTNKHPFGTINEEMETEVTRFSMFANFGSAAEHMDKKPRAHRIKSGFSKKAWLELPLRRGLGNESDFLKSEHCSN